MVCYFKRICGINQAEDRVTWPDLLHRHTIALASFREWSVVSARLRIRAQPRNPCRARNSASAWTCWMEISRYFYTIARVPASGSQSHMAARAPTIGNYSTRGSMLFDNSSHVSGICHQSYQCFSMLNASDGARDRLWCKDQGVLTWVNISPPRLASRMV